VETVGTLQQLRTQYVYENGPAEVFAEGGWDKDPNVSFVMSYRVEFEAGTADFMFGREPELRLERPGQSVEPVALTDGTGYDAEISHLVRAVHDLRAGQSRPLIAHVHEAVDLMNMLAAERRSLESGERVALSG
jgi:hypothetical protein